MSKGGFSTEFIEKTKQVWQPYASTPLSNEEAQEIADNMLGLAAYLDDLRRKRETKETNLPA